MITKCEKQHFHESKESAEECNEWDTLTDAERISRLQKKIIDLQGEILRLKGEIAMYKLEEIHEW